MGLVLLFTVFGNLLLVYLLVVNGWYLRFGWLTSAAVYSVIADAILQQIHTQSHAVYDDALTVSQFVCVWLNLMIIFFSPSKSVRIPTEFQLGTELVAFLLKQAGFLWGNYYLRCGLAVTNLLMILLFIWLFKKEDDYAPELC